MIRTIASDTLWEKKEEKKEIKGRFGFGFLPSVLKAVWGLHAHARTPPPIPNTTGCDR